jgi:hypothetical protein
LIASPNDWPDLSITAVLVTAETAEPREPDRLSLSDTDNPELGEDVGHMLLRGSLADHEPVGDAGVGASGQSAPRRLATR